jgi:hypothetical protein
MQIHIWLDRAEPPQGHAEVVNDPPGGTPEVFVGWLGLLRALYALIELGEEKP